MNEKLKELTPEELDKYSYFTGITEEEYKNTEFRTDSEAKEE